MSASFASWFGVKPRARSVFGCSWHRRMMTMSKTTLITSRDRKRGQYLDLCAVPYDRARLDAESAQRLNERGGELQARIAQAIRELSLSNRYADGEVESTFTYPPEYTGPKPIEQQIDMIAKTFSLSLGWTIEFMEKVFPHLTLPSGAEGWFAWPSIDAVAARFFADVKNPGERYCRAVALVFEKIGATRQFYNYRSGQIDPQHLRQTKRTRIMMKRIQQYQKGDILVVPAQFGLRYRGKSVRRGHEIYGGDEFGLPSFTLGCMLLTHPERLVRWKQLHIDCAGDKFSEGADGVFSLAPFFSYCDSKVKFSAYRVDDAGLQFGSASAFCPQYPRGLKVWTWRIGCLRHFVGNLLYFIEWTGFWLSLE